MKAEGIEYDQRMELLEEVTYPKPLEELLDAAFETYRADPAVGAATSSCSPKSVVRDMYERAMTFGEYIGFYQLAPQRGARAALPLRRLPRRPADDPRRGEDRGPARPDRVARRARAPGRLEPARRVGGADQPRPTQPTRHAPVVPPAPHRLTTQPARVPRAGAQRAVPRVQLAALEKYEELGELDAASGFTADAWADAMDAYFAEHDSLGTDADARSSAHAHHRRGPRRRGRCGRSSPTRPATTTGASAPRSTWPSRTRPARPCCG